MGKEELSRILCKQKHGIADMLKLAREIDSEAIAEIVAFDIGGRGDWTGKDR